MSKTAGHSLPEMPRRIQSFLQCRGMFPLVAAVGMTRTARPRHGADGTEIRTAILARVAVFFAPLVEFMPALVASCRMPGTARPRQRLHTAETRPAMLAIEFCHFPFPFLLVVWIACSTVERHGDLFFKQISCQPCSCGGIPPFFARMFRK